MAAKNCLHSTPTDGRMSSDNVGAWRSHKSPERSPQRALRARARARCARAHRGSARERPMFVLSARLPRPSAQNRLLAIKADGGMRLVVVATGLPLAEASPIASAEAAERRAYSKSVCARVLCLTMSQTPNRCRSAGSAE